MIQIDILDISGFSISFSSAGQIPNPLGLLKGVWPYFVVFGNC